MAKGYIQRAGIDYTETFSLVVKFDSIRTILYVGAVEDLDIHQFDMKSAYLKGDIMEEIFMDWPLGFANINDPHAVCGFLKFLYGLLQTNPTILYSDNQSCIRLVRNPEFHRRTKHI